MAKRIGVAYGESGVGKTVALIRLFLWLRAQHIAAGKGEFIARAYVGDGSAATYEESGLVEDGLIELVNYDVYDWPMDTVNLITEGWAPRGMVEGAPLVAPKDQPTFPKVGLWLYEGLAVMSTYIMGGYRVGGLAEMASRGVKIGPDAAIRIQSQLYEKNQLGDADITRPIKGSGTGNAYGSNGTAHYGMAQTHMVGAVQRSKALPGWVYWTTHERAAKDKSGMKKEGLGAAATVYGGGETLIGPEVVGEALTAGFSKTIHETLHFQAATSTVKGTVPDAVSKKLTTEVVKEHRIYTRNHMDPDGATNLRYKAVVRTMKPKLIADYYVSRPDQEAGDAIVNLYEDLAKAQRVFRDENTAPGKAAA